MFQCKNVKSPMIQHIFEHSQLLNLNLGFIEDISDEAFALLPPVMQLMDGSAAGGLYPAFPSSSFKRSSPLQKLNLCKSKITDSSIFKMAYLMALLEIRLQWCSGITDAGITALVRNCPKLRLLDLKSCQITDNGISAIAELCTELCELDLSWCPGFSEEGLLQLVPHHHGEVTQKQSLERLNLEWCAQVTDRTLYALQAIASLKVVQLAGCVGVTEAGVQWLKCNGKVVES